MTTGSHTTLGAREPARDAAGAWRSRRLSRPALVVAALVAASTLVRFGVAQAFTTPWIAPDEMVYGMIGESLWTHGTLTLRGFAAPYYSILTPALVGAPLAAFGLTEGIQWARLFQGLAMSLVAVPTYVWTCRLTSRRWAAAAAALVLTAPALHYAGFLMTEPLTLLTVTVALLMLARALEKPTTWRYGVFVAWTTLAAAVRLQALVLLPAFLLAAVIDAAAARDRKRLRPLLGLGAVAVLVVVVVLTLVLASGGELSRRSVLGAYTPLGETAPVGGHALPQILWHAFDVAVLGLGVPALALAALSGRVLGGRDHDPRMRAFVSTTLAYAALLVVQVGLFSSVYVGHVAERYLLTLLPLLAIALCAWIGRGAPRERVVVLTVWGALVALALLVPVDQLVYSGSLVNTFTTAPLGALDPSWARTVLVAAALVAGALVTLLPPRLAWVCAVAVGTGLALLSLDTARRIADASEHEQRVTMGSGSPTWIDDLHLGDSTFLVTGDRIWTSVARSVFWNRSVHEVLRVSSAAAPFPPTTTPVDVGADGVLRTPDGNEFSRPLVVAPETVMLSGDAVATRAAGDSEVPGLAVWRPEDPVRLEMRRDGFMPNGDFTDSAQITVYGCRPGTLDVTILGKSGDPVRAFVDGIQVATLETAAGTSAVHKIPAPPYSDGTHACGYELQTDGLAGSTAIVFTPS